jgi:hypothetical protein
VFIATFRRLEESTIGASHMDKTSAGAKRHEATPQFFQNTATVSGATP